jgi:hypothetical protein
VVHGSHGMRGGGRGSTPGPPVVVKYFMRLTVDQ